MKIVLLLRELLLRIWVADPYQLELEFGLDFLEFGLDFLELVFDFKYRWCTIADRGCFTPTEGKYVVCGCVEWGKHTPLVGHL